jgi:hypothetical protein
VHALKQPCQAAAARGARPDADRVDRGHAHRAPHRHRGREQWQRQPQRRALDVQVRLEAGACDGQREELLHDAREPRVGGEADRDAEDDTGDRDLRAQQQRAAGERPRRHAERHADADLTALRFDRAADEVEGGERGRTEQQEREDVEHLLVALGVLVDQPMRGLLIARGEGEAGTRQRRAE